MLAQMQKFQRKENLGINSWTLNYERENTERSKLGRDKIWKEKIGLSKEFFGEDGLASKWNIKCSVKGSNLEKKMGVFN